jgi:endonuclease YncB( thermonuclease family)
MPRLSFTALANPRRGNASLVACVLLAASVIAVELINPNLLPHPKATTAYRPYGDGGRQVLSDQVLSDQVLSDQVLSDQVLSDQVLADQVLADKTLANTRVYAAEVVRIIDGDTFVARMRTGPAGDVETRVRLRSIDAAELHARCSKELRLALAARAALQRLLTEGSVMLSHVGRDKYPGRIDANVATRNNVDVSAAMLNGGWARAYDGGRRGTWCR